MTDDCLALYEFAQLSEHQSCEWTFSLRVLFCTILYTRPLVYNQTRKNNTDLLFRIVGYLKVELGAFLQLQLRLQKWVFERCCWLSRMSNTKPLNRG